MEQDDIPQIRDVASAIGLLSRLPVPVNESHATARGARAAWAYPIAGFVVALIAACIAQMALWFGLSSILAAGLALVTLVISTGALHEDGLADTADGLWGGWTKERRLEIMKDSHIGAYGVIALVIGLGLRWQALALVIDAGALWSGLIAVAMLSRTMMLPVMARLTHARDAGLSHSVGRPSLTTSRIGEAVGMFAALLLWQFSGLWLIGVAIASALVCAGIAKSKIGGQTGDILGATQQVTEIALLLTLAAMLA